MEKLAKKLGVGLNKDSWANANESYLEYNQVIQPNPHRVTAPVIVHAKFKPDAPLPYQAVVIIDGKTAGVSRISSDVSASSLKFLVGFIRQATLQLLVRRCACRRVAMPKSAHPKNPHVRKLLAKLQQLDNDAQNIDRLRKKAIRDLTRALGS